jgi:hypothetical protein
MRKISGALFGLMGMIVAIVASTASVASAQVSFFESLGGTNLGTPDAMPPARESACAGLTGAAHGLCTAWCEAMDCDSDNPQASPQACEATAARFARITNGDVMPCSCPCVGRVTNFIEALNGDFGRYLCVDVVLVPPDAAVLTLLVTDLGLVGSQTSFDIGACGFPASSFLIITRQQAEQCNALVRQKAAEAGLPCGYP